MVRYGLAAAGLVACVLPAGAQVAKPAAPEQTEVHDLVKRGQCEQAVQVLNERLKAGEPAFQGFAGLLFEVGACVKKDWPKAEAFYLKAAQAGNEQARLRLTAAYADRVGGPDVGASLWWAHVAAVPRPQACVLARFDAKMDPDAFVKSVDAWGPTKVRSCAYVGGVVAGMMASMMDTDLPDGGATVRLVRMVYEPGEGRFVVRRFDAGRAVEERRWRVGDALGDSADLLGQLQAASLAAVRRYGASPGVDPAWRVDLEWQFGSAR